MRHWKSTDPAVNLELLLENWLLDWGGLGSTSSGSEGTSEVVGAGEG